MSDVTSSFAEVLDAVDKLTLPEQEELIEIVRRRMAEQRRHEILKDVEEAVRDFKAGRCRVVSPDELIKEITS